MVVATSREEGSKPGGAGGAGLWEFRRRAAWMGVEAGLEAEGPVVPGVDGSPVVSPSCWRSCASWLLS